MAEVAQGSRPGRDRTVFAFVLIVVGIIGLITQIWEPTADVGGWIVFVIGLGFLGAFVYTHQYGYLVPGGIMTGLGLGIVASEVITWESSQGEGGAVVLGLGLGFVSIWVIGTLMKSAQSHWWPVVPGGILTIVGAALLIGGTAIDLLDYWGIAVVAVGLFILWRAWAEGRSKV
ncbi:MAG: hypothetical protein FIA92_06275 [Chloroflexi bacterium]|nr:hypothetical protein [Chloroflexota bacterium]